MAQSFLEKIRPEVIASVNRLKEERPISEWAEQAHQRPVKARFRDALSRPRALHIIAEIKKASPSRGIIRERFDPVELARAYEAHGAAAISVLTEEKYFLGSVQSMAQVAAVSRLPILRKDFILDEVQIAQARSKGASAVLLIVAFLDRRSLAELLSACARYELDALVEVHDQEELSMAVERGASIIGVNNRNLKTLEVDMKVAENLIAHKRPGLIFVAESGLTSHEQLQQLTKLGYDAFLIGEHFMKSPDPGAALDLVRGKS